MRGATSLLCDDGNTTSGGQVQPSPILKSENMKERFYKRQDEARKKTFRTGQGRRMTGHGRIRKFYIFFDSVHSIERLRKIQ